MLGLRLILIMRIMMLFVAAAGIPPALVWMKIFKRL